MMPNILITTLGTTWQIVPELVGFMNPELLDLYRNHPARDRIQSLLKEYDIEPVDEVWVVTTIGQITDRPVESLLTWHGMLDETFRPVIRVWRVDGVQDLASEDECNIMSECIHRVVLHATEIAGAGNPVLSLAGGRKTMSNDMQNAGSFFGCRALLHVIENGKHIGSLRELSPSHFTSPLAQELADAVTPLVTGKFRPNPLLHLRAEESEFIGAKRFSMPMPPDRDPLPFIIPDRDSLTEIVRKKIEKAETLFCNYTTEMLRGESSTTFLALYSLSPNKIEELKSTRIGVDPAGEEIELSWLKKIPKAELHCHLGGIATVAEMIEIARESKPLVDKYRTRLDPWIEKWRHFIDEKTPEEIRGHTLWKDIRSAVPEVPEPGCSAAFLLLFEDRPELLDRVLYGPYLEESRFCGIGFEPYETLGDLQGSGLLQSEGSIRAACGTLSKKAVEHNVRYMEIRCSPCNYVRGGLTSEDVARVIDEGIGSLGRFSHSLIFIASRHGALSRVWEHVELAERLLGNDGSGFPGLQGFDLAGNEKTRSAGAMREALMPMMEKCLHLTIHAGEKEAVDSVWEGNRPGDVPFQQFSDYRFPGQLPARHKTSPCLSFEGIPRRGTEGHCEHGQSGYLQD
ncbi:MAG: hypothetical protein JRJ85_06115 [Deltaproteobacteria bacterium]|nr:hypothetical protein [Deltaproteobacteria bacterium]